MTEWRVGDPLYKDPRHVFDETGWERQIVRRMFDLWWDHKDNCLFCESGTPSHRAMTVTFEKEVRAA